MGLASIRLGERDDVEDKSGKRMGGKLDPY
jgi:hypothetical protein